MSYAKFYSRSQNVVVRVFNGGGYVIEAHEAAVDFTDW